MALELRNFETMLQDPRLKQSFSRKQLLSHFRIYQEHIIKLYQLEMALKEVDKATASYPWGEFSELRRRHAVTFNGTVLHELYFEGLTGDVTEITPAVGELITRDFGSVKAWAEDLRASARVGQWVLLTYSHPEKRLKQSVITENHIGVPVNQTILIALDTWEHAWMVDYPGHIEDYLDVFMQHLNWSRVNLRLKLGVKT